MIEYSGRAYSRAADTVTGRLLCADGTYGGRERGAKILIWDGRTEIGDTVIENAVGIVLPDGADGYDAQRLARLYRVPTLALPCSFSELGEHVSDKIGILDSSRGKLYVNPDLETICALFGERRKRHGTGISRLAVCDGICAVPEGFEGLVVGYGLPDGTGEEAAYEYFCDIADKNTGAKIVASVPMGDGGAAFVSRVRAVYRAGVWGRFSLLCSGVFTPEHTDRCISILHSAFRELDGEGREFDGFMRKGIVIETPIQLLARHRLRAFDFCCLDTDALVRRFCASDDTDAGIFAIAGYIEGFVGGADSGAVALMAKGRVPQALVDRLAVLGVATEIYVGEKNI